MLFQCEEAVAVRAYPDLVPALGLRTVKRSVRSFQQIFPILVLLQRGDAEAGRQPVSGRQPRNLQSREARAQPFGEKTRHAEIGAAQQDRESSPPIRPTI